MCDDNFYCIKVAFCKDAGSECVSIDYENLRNKKNLMKEKTVAAV